MNRKTLLENMELIISYSAKKQEQDALGQVSLFASEENDQETTKTRLDIQEVADFEDREKLGYEQSLMGIFVSGHPLDRFSDVMRQMSSMQISNVQDMTGEGKRKMTLAGLVTGRKNIITKKGDKMCFATLEDLTGKIECIVFPKTFAEYEDLLAGDEPLIMDGEVNLAEEPRKFFPAKIQKLKDQAEERVTGVRITLSVDDTNSNRLNKFKQVLLSYRGSVKTHLVLNGSEASGRLYLGEDFLVNPSPQMAAKINEVFNCNSVQFIVDGKASSVETH
jgi:DNA polymerase-3 subunit alpha